MVLFALALAGCLMDGGKPEEDWLPSGVALGDELVLELSTSGADGDWSDEAEPGALFEVTVGANVRHVVVPGGRAHVTQRVALGAWDGGDFTMELVSGGGSTLAAEASVTVDPAAANVPLLGSYDERWWNDTPLVTYEEDGLWTWVFTDEDGGTGLLPTLLLASWGRPVDIEGLWDEASGTIQTTDHAWVSFDGAYEGTHPRFEVVTANGLIGPYEDAPYVFAPMPLPFDTAGGTVPREGVLDVAPWVLATAWGEARREGQVAADGGQDDYLLGEPDEYVFVDYDVAGGARVSFEAEVDGVWWSSLNGLATSGLTDATVSGIGRTCVELPPGAAPADVTALRVRSHAGTGTVAATWFAYDAGFARVEMGEADGVSVEDGGTADLP